MALFDNVLLYTDMDRNLAYDAIGTNNGGISGATGTSDRFTNANHALTFDGTNDYVLFSNVGTLLDFGTRDFTFWGWIKPTLAAGFSYDTLWTTYSTTFGYGDGFIFTTSVGVTNGFGCWNATDGWLQSNLVPIVGSYQFVAYRRSAGVLNVYQDSTKSANIAFSGSVTPTNKFVFIGESILDGSYGHFKGDHGEWCILSRALDDTELKAIYDLTSYKYIYPFTRGECK